MKIWYILPQSEKRAAFATLFLYPNGSILINVDIDYISLHYVILFTFVFLWQIFTFLLPHWIFFFFFLLQGSEYLEGYSINITKTFKQHQYCKPKQRSFVAESVEQTDLGLPVLHEMDNNNIIEGAARSSRSSAATETQGLSKAEDCSKSFVTTFWYASAFIILQWHNQWSLTRSSF